MALKFRRGTTAQKSGSLAYGEPYVNIELGTLQIGGDTGDITLNAAGTASTFVGASVSASSFISGSSLKITGNAAIDGNLTLGGAITIGDATADTVNVVASLSSSLVPSNDNVFNIGSTSYRYANVYATTVSASAYTGLGNLTTYSTSVASRVNTLETAGYAVSSSVASATATSISTLSASAYQVDATQSANITTATNAAAGAFASASAYSSSAFQVDLTQSVNIATATAAAAGAFASASAYSSSAFQVDLTQSAAITSNSSSAATSFSASLASQTALSASIATRDNSQDTTTTTISTSVASRLTTIEAFRATTGSNTFQGNQTITGSVYVSGDMIVQGTSSLQNVTASVASIGTNTIILNTATPAVRFGGLSVQDSGSGAGRSGSLWWDSVNDHWIYVVPSGSAEGYNSAMLMNGPKNSGSLGSEVGLTSNYVPKSQGEDHITDSQITDDGTTVSIPGNLTVTGSITGYATSASIATATANSITTLSSSVKARTDQTIAIAGTSVGLGGTISAATILNSTTVLSGSNSITINGTSVALGGTLTTAQTLAGAISASAQVDGTLIQNKSITINGTSVALGGTLTAAQTLAGSISSSAQVAHDSTTGYSANKHVDHTTVSISAGSGISGGGDISATRTITLDTASAHFISGSRKAETTTSTTGASGITLAYDQGLGTLSATIANPSVTINGTSLSLGGTLTTAQTIAGAVSASGQIDHNSTTNYVANRHIDHTAVSITAGLGIAGGGDISSTRTISLDTGSATFITGSRNSISVSSTTGANGVTLSYSALGVVSATLANSSMTINGTSVSLGGTLSTAQTLAGAISSSGQVDLTATTNYGTYINQAVKTTSAVTFAGITSTSNVIVTGSISATGDIVAYSTSDKRHKNNITLISDALTKVTKLNGVTWEWNDDVDSITKETPKTGLIAQEVKEVLPEVVKERGDGFLALDYSKMMGLMVEAIKEQQQQIHSLTLEIEKLKKSNSI